jgi:hypothetical protein
MPVPRLNNVQTADAYTDALTVQFPFPRGSFSVQVTNAAVYYQVSAVAPPLSPKSHSNWEPGEHFSLPAFLSFRDPTAEGFPAQSVFTGIRIRSAVTGTPARITIA